MKPQFHFSRHLAVLAGILIISACGQRGPLYMPTKPAAAPATPTAPASPAATGATQNNTAPSSASSSE